MAEYQTLLLEFSIQNIKEYENELLKFSFMPVQRVYDYVDSDSSVSRIEKTVLYDNKITAISGINASGKTTLLDWICFILRIYFCNESLSNPELKELLNRFYFNKAIKINILYMSNNNIFSAESYVEKDRDDFRFSEEIIYEYIKPVLTKRSLYLDDKYRKIMCRSHLTEESKAFLESGKSIIFSTLSKNDNARVYRGEVTEGGNLDAGVSFASLVGLPYFDPSIEYIGAKGNGLFEIKRKTKDAEEVTQSRLLSMLSSGTLRGINIIGKLVMVLKDGGYLLIDEIEDHFNKTIVMNIIELFMKKSTNPNGAHLIFSTHYQELLDILPRNDSVYITTRDDDLFLTVRNLSEFLKRHDIKKSDILFSDYYDLGTAINYDAYRNFRRNVEAIVKSTEERA